MTDMFGFAMIVKNEEAIIGKTIRNLVEYDPDYITICDTGSTDNTTEAIVQARPSGSCPVYINRIQWHGFGHARSTALRFARSTSRDKGHTMMVDADDKLVSLQRDKLDATKANAHTVMVELGNVHYHRVCIFSNKADWYYKGVVHEFPYCRKQDIDNTIVGFIQAGVSGARSQDKLKYLRDADAINKAMQSDALDGDLYARYMFYLAQSYRDAGHNGAAIYWYGEVANRTANWREERYIANLMLGRLTGNKDHYVRAALMNPERAEAWRELGLHDMADKCVPQPHWLFVETAAYRL